MGVKVSLDNIKPAKKILFKVIAIQERGQN